MIHPGKSQSSRKEERTS